MARSGRRQMSRGQEQEIVEAVAGGESQTEVAGRRGISRQAVGKAVHRYGQKELGGRRPRRSSVIEMSGQCDLVELFKKVHRVLQRTLGQLESSSPDGRLSPEVSSWLDKVIDLAEKARRYGED